MSFGSRLREARKNAGLTQQELANKIGTAKSTITGWDILFEFDVDTTAAFHERLEERETMKKALLIACALFVVYALADHTSMFRVGGRYEVH